MTRRLSVPAYRLHRASGQAVVTLTDPCGTRRDYYLGPHGSPTSQAEYGRLIAEWTAANKCLPFAGPVPNDLTIDEVIARFWAHIETHYRDRHGKPTAEVGNFRLSLRPLVNRSNADQWFCAYPIAWPIGLFGNTFAFSDSILSAKARSCGNVCSRRKRRRTASAASPSRPAFAISAVACFSMA